MNFALVRTSPLASLKAASRALTPSLGLLSALALSACGGNKKDAEAPAAVSVDNHDEFDDGMEMMQEVGGMNEEKVTRNFKRLQPKLIDCLMSAGESHEYMFGDVAFLVTVDRNGKAISAHAEKSTLGNYQAERCMLDILGASNWPKPVGGLIGHARNGMGYDAPDDIRPPVEWSESDVRDSLSEADNAGMLEACGAGGPFEITAYVEPSGRVASAGVAHTDDKGEETAACLVGAVEGMKFRSPGSWRAKVSFHR